MSSSALAVDIYQLEQFNLFSDTLILMIWFNIVTSLFFPSSASRRAYTVGPLIIELAWAMEWVSTGALEALDNPLLVYTMFLKVQLRFCR